MEIQTTIKEFPGKMQKLEIDPETTIRVIVDHSEKHHKKKSNKSQLAFLHSGFWDGEDGPRDIAENHDHYIYDS